MRLVKELPRVMKSVINQRVSVAPVPVFPGAGLRRRAWARWRRASRNRFQICVRAMGFIGLQRIVHGLEKRGT